jgi:hypothetical protein
VGGLAYNGTSADLWHTGAHPDSDNHWRYDEVVNKKLTFVGDGVTKVSGDVERDKYGRVIAGTDTRTFVKNDRIVSYEKYIMDYGRGRQNIVDPTFLKIREASVAYSIPKNIASIVRASSATIALTGQNLFLWAKEFKFADPDIDKDDLNSPSYRYLGVNIKLNF